MHYKFNISGITCSACIEKITELLEKKLDIKNLTFSQENSQIEFDSAADIDAKRLNILLATIGKYTVAVDSIDDTSYKPIYLIFGYLIAVNLLITMKNFQIEVFMANFMAGFFLIFSFFKMLDLKGFAEGYASYDIVAKRFFNYGYAYPFIELGFGIGYLLFSKSLFLNIIVFIVMLISSAGVIKAKLSKQSFYCACVGTFLKVPLGTLAIIENLTMTIMSLLMIIQLV